MRRGDLGREEVLDLLTQLVDKSLVVVGERDGQARYGMLETLRQYGREKLEGSDEAGGATVSGKTTVKGKLNSAPDLGYVVQFYSNPSGNEGKKFLGQKLVSTDGSGNATFVFSPAAAVAVGQTITVTATDRVGNASEFSAPKTVALASGAAPSPETLKVRGPSGVTKNPTAHFEFASSDPRVTFECSLNGRAYHECSSPENINRLSEGRHTFLVRAVDEEGTSDPSPAAWIWSVDRKG